jgi:cytochrome-b5 reductase
VYGFDASGEKISRSYTPVSLGTQKGYFELLVKRYEGGKMSCWLHNLKEGDLVEMKGPIGNFKYSPRQWKAIGMIGGGTGITPLLQVARTILNDPQDTTQLSLVYSNQTIEDILLKDEIDALALQHSSFKVFHTLTRKAPDDGTWRGGVGRISAEMLKRELPTPGDVKILLCGPAPFNTRAEQLLKEIGFRDSMIYKF